MSEPPAPPYCSATSMPISPIPKYCDTSAGSILPARSIAPTRGFTSSAAKLATASRNASSSSDNIVSGGRALAVSMDMMGRVVEEAGQRELVPGSAAVMSLTGRQRQASPQAVVDRDECQQCEASSALS